jgi:hypothetical protein
LGQLEVDFITLKQIALCRNLVIFRLILSTVASEVRSIQRPQYPLYGCVCPCGCNASGILIPL